MHALGLPLNGAIFDILVEFFLDRLVVDRLIPLDEIDGPRCAAAEGAEDTPAEARCTAAYRENSDRFRDALAEARDMTGLRLAATWRGMPSYSGMARRFLRVI